MLLRPFLNDAGAHNPQLAYSDADAFAEALLADVPPRPPGQERIVAANRAGRAGAIV